MYLSEAAEIFDYWEGHPPTYQMVSIIAQFLGWKPQAGARPVAHSAPAAAPSIDAGALAAMPGMAMAPMPEWARGSSVIDFEQIKKLRVTG